MAGWDYARDIDGTAIAPYVDRDRFVGEPVGGFRGKLLDIAYKHGAYAASRHWSKAQLVMFETFLRYTDGNGNITHPDGAAGHAFQNRSELAKLMKSGIDSTFVMTQNTPDYGTVRANMIALDAAVPEDRKSTRLNSSHSQQSRMPSSA